MKLALIGLLLAGSLFAQQPIAYDGRNNPQLPRYEYIAATSSKITVQSCSTCDPAYLETIDISCSADATLTFSVNGTAATATAGTLKPIGQGASQKAPNVFTNSDVGSGTTLKTFAVAAATATSAPQSYDVTMFMVPGGGPTSQNWSVGVSTGSCTFQLTFRTKYQ